MPNEPRYKTAYEEYVNSNIVRMLRERVGLYNYKELAELVGLKPTQHFKRRINQMVHHGLIVLTPAFTPRGGIENRFTLPDDNSLGDLPF
jgi:hypothetical protein